MGVASRSAGGIGRPTLGCTSFVPFVTGLAFGEAGMERPSRGGPRCWRPPGTGGLNRGTEVDMLERRLGADQSVWSTSTVLSLLQGRLRVLHDVSRGGVGCGGRGRLVQTDDGASG